MRGTCYNVWIYKRGGKTKSHRTTVHLSELLSNLLSLKLGHEPSTPEARRAVREWLQEATLRRQLDYWVSQKLQDYIVEALLEGDLKKRYDRWWDEKLDTEVRQRPKKKPSA